MIVRKIMQNDTITGVMIKMIHRKKGIVSGAGKPRVYWRTIVPLVWELACGCRNTVHKLSLSQEKNEVCLMKWSTKIVGFLNLDSRGGTGGFRGRGDLKSMTSINGHWKRLFVGLGVVTFCRHCIGYNPSSTAFRASGTLHKQCLHNVKPNPTKTVYQCPSDELTGPLHG